MDNRIVLKQIFIVTQDEQVIEINKDLVMLIDRSTHLPLFGDSVMEGEVVSEPIDLPKELN